MRLWLLFLSVALSAQDLQQLEQESLFYRSTQWASVYSTQLAKAKAPSLTRETEKCLATASVWYSLDMMALGPTPLATLAQPELWDLFQQMGIQAIDLQGLGALRQTNAERDWGKIVDLAGVRAISLVGHPLSPVFIQGPDFQLALRNVKEYPHLFHLVEIDRPDWPLLPKVSMDNTAPLSMPQVQKLRKLGYLDGRPEQVYPYAATSCWEATGSVKGEDNRLRRWVFLRQAPSGLPALNWLDPTFASIRLAGGELLDAILHLQQQFLVLDTIPLLCHRTCGLSPSANALESLSLLARKLGAFTALRADASLNTLKSAPCDLVYDRFTRPALLHALIGGDAEALRLIYRIFLEENVSARLFLHEVPNFAEARCEWTEFLFDPQTTYRYNEDEITGDLLLERLKKEDLARLSRSPSEYTPPIAPLFGLCPDGTPDYSALQQAHLLLCLFYALQPGAFSFSALDLRGAAGTDAFKGQSLYPPLSRALKDPHSFASTLQSYLAIRRAHHFEAADLLEILPTAHKGLVLLLQRLPSGLLALSATNFSRSKIAQTVRHPSLVNTWAVELLSSQAEPKLFGSPTFDLHLDALAGKVFLLQQKYYTE